MIPIFAITGYAKTGKTTLILEILQALQAKGYRVAVIKHDPLDHGEVDRQGSDTANFWEVGCKTVALSSPSRLVIFRRVEKDTAPEQIVPLCGDVDCVLLEGYKGWDYPKIVIWSGQKEIFKERSPELLAVIYNKGDEKEILEARKQNSKIPVLPREDLPGIITLLEKNLLQNR
ncbi:MAG: molybdopterin-guanine dinucleotide biosynthesis protein B [Dethiobacteria bacterium]|jgi:molybdopterin-guanine dinucleotide biosynthesis protein B